MVRLSSSEVDGAVSVLDDETLSSVEAVGWIPAGYCKRLTYLFIRSLCVF